MWSTFERRILNIQCQEGYRLSDNGQYRPTDVVHVQADFYYERRRRPGVCVFVDGPDHDRPREEEHDRQIRAELDDLGFRVIAIRHDRPVDEQLRDAPDVFGTGR